MADNCSKNLMKPSNLGVVFGPTLMRPERETVASIVDIRYQNIVVDCIIQHLDDVGVTFEIMCLSCDLDVLFTVLCWCYRLCQIWRAYSHHRPTDISQLPLRLAVFLLVVIDDSRLLLLGLWNER